MNTVIHFLTSSDSELSGVFLGIMIGCTIFFALLSLLSPKIRKKTKNKALKKTLARSKKTPIFLSILYPIFLLLRLENNNSWIGNRIWLILLTSFAIFWIIRKALLYIKIYDRIQKAEKRRKKS